MFSFFSKEKPKKGNVFVGVSGGVDSSVSAALLIEQGYNVVGVFIRTWQPDWIECTWRDERRDAMRVCAHLNIPFAELNLEDEYKEGVADYMIAEYRAGRTPNPDVMCNREVKFGGFLSWALRNGADYIATGHYARNNGQLLQGIDPTKDQSYFLWTLTNGQLSKVLFPIGDLQKTQVRKLAEQFKLPTAAKKDSQGICFIGEIDMKDFLSHYIETRQGDVLDESGSVIGYHQGSLFYTLGERHGFVIIKKTDHDLPYYVVEKNLDRNTITVSQTPAHFKTRNQVILADCVWRIDPTGQERKSQIRYHGALLSCWVTQDQNGEYNVSFKESDYSISPGQSIVIYDRDICLGGGVVK